MGYFYFLTPICIWRTRPSICIYRPRSSIFVCLFFVLQSKFVIVNLVSNAYFAVFSEMLWARGCVIVTVSTYINSSSHHMYLLFKYNVGNELIGIVWNFSQKFLSIFLIFSIFFDAGGKCWSLKSRRWTLDPGLWILDSRLWTLDSGRWTLGTRLWTLDDKTLKF